MSPLAGVRAPRRVPLGRRVLFGDRRRGALTIGGVAAALLLTLVLDAVLSGALERVTYYLRTSSAQVFVSQAGVRTMHMSSSVLPAETVQQVGAVPGAAWAAPIAFASGAIGGPGGRQLSYVIGYDTATGRGGPSALASGRPPRVGEVVIDEVAADHLALAVGSTAAVLGQPLTVSGLSRSGTSITNTTAFIALEQFAALRGDTVSYVLVGADAGTSPEDLAHRLAAQLPDLTVQTRGQFVASESRIVRDMSADLMALMNLLGFLIALAVIALGLLTSTLARLRDYAVLKAVGASTRRLAAAIAAQVGWTLALALILASAVAWLLTVLVPLVAPALTLSLTLGGVMKTAAGAAAAGLLAALLPLVRLARIDPATAFREHR